MAIGFLVGEANFNLDLNEFISFEGASWEQRGLSNLPLWPAGTKSRANKQDSDKEHPLRKEHAAHKEINGDNQGQESHCVKSAPPYSSRDKWRARKSLISLESAAEAARQIIQFNICYPLETLQNF